MFGGPSTVRGPAEEFRRRRPARRAGAGFSLLELLLVAVILVLVLTMYFAFAARQKAPSKIKNCQKNLLKIYIAMDIYATDHAGKFPDAPGARTSGEALTALVPRYTVDTSAFICPGSRDAALPAGEPFAARKISYAYYMGRAKADASAVLMSDEQVDASSKTPGQPVFSTNDKPPGNNHGQAGGNFLFCDGRADNGPASAPFSLVFSQGVVLLNP